MACEPASGSVSLPVSSLISVGGHRLIMIDVKTDGQSGRPVHGPHNLRRWLQHAAQWSVSSFAICRAVALDVDGKPASLCGCDAEIALVFRIRFAVPARSSLAVAGNCELRY
jgi:hypothetical protein